MAQSATQGKKALKTPQDHRADQQRTLSRVRDAVHELNMMVKPTGDPSPPPLHSSSSHRLAAPNQMKRNSVFQLNPPPPSPIYSSNESMVNPIDAEPQRQLVVDKAPVNRARKRVASPKKAPLPNRAVSPKKAVKRSPPPPPIPPKTRIFPKSTKDTMKHSLYTNGGHDVDDEIIDDQFDRSGDMYEQDDVDFSTLQDFAKPTKTHCGHAAPLTSSPVPINSNNRANPITNGRHRGEDNPSPKLSYHQKDPDMDSIGLEIAESESRNHQRMMIDNGFGSVHHNHVARPASLIADYEGTEAHQPREDPFHSSGRSPPPASTSPYPQGQQYLTPEPLQPYQAKRMLPIATFMMEIGALLVVFIISMVLVLAILGEKQPTLRTIMQLSYCYIYFVSILWMIWCTIDITRFRRQWAKLTSSAHDQEEYMGIAERYTHEMFYFPDVHNTGGLFMRVGAGLLCMGSMILTIIEAAKMIATLQHNRTSRNALGESDSLAVSVTTSIAYILRFFFHCVQFMFLFRYGNLVVNRYHITAQIGLLHLVTANFCTWFQAIVFETLEQIHKYPKPPTTLSSFLSNTTYSMVSNAGWETTDATSNVMFDDVIKAISSSDTSGGEENRSPLGIIEQIEESLSKYLYPCLIEYSLISLTVFFIMWRNVGKKGDTYLRFGDRHIFTINCSRASRGLLVGGIILLLTIVSLVPTYLVNDKDQAKLVAQITELALLAVALVIVCVSLYQTTTLYYDPHAHVDVFDQALILITTVGDFGYSLFGLFASLSISPMKGLKQHSARIEIVIGFLGIVQTFLQSGFILDTLKRRTRTKYEIRNKPGRELITALLLTNLSVWLHDSLSAKKVLLNPFQVEYYDAGTWAIIQAFTSPLSIFYRFHSSVCLADIWQEVFKDHSNHGLVRNAGNLGMLRLPDNH